MDEADLIALLQKGDEGAFKLLVDTYKNRVFNVVLGFVQHTENAEEVTQDVFVKVFETIGAFRQQSQLSTWLYRIAVNQSIDFMRKARRKKRSAIITSLFNRTDELTYQPAHFDHPGVLLENKERASVLFKAINRLPDKQKTAFLLQKMQGCTQQKIGAIMQLNESAVESLLMRAKTNLKKLLVNYYSA